MRSIFWYYIFTLTMTTTTDTLKLSIAIENLKKLVDIAYDRFDDDFTLDELESLERAAELVGNVGIASTVRYRIEKGNYI